MKTTIKETYGMAGATLAATMLLSVVAFISVAEQASAYGTIGTKGGTLFAAKAIRDAAFTPCNSAGAVLYVPVVDGDGKLVGYEKFYCQDVAGMGLLWMPA